MTMSDSWRLAVSLSVPPPPSADGIEQPRLNIDFIATPPLPSLPSSPAVSTRQYLMSSQTEENISEIFCKNISAWRLHSEIVYNEAVAREREKEGVSILKYFNQLNI